MSKREVGTQRAVALTVGAGAAITVLGALLPQGASASRTVPAASSSALRNLVRDGTFSSPPAGESHPGAYQGQGIFTDFCARGYTDPDCPIPYPTFGAWRVTSGSIDVNAPNYVGAPAGPAGTQSVDLDGYDQIGAISQTLTTKRGRRYTGTFMLAANPLGMTPPSNAAVKRLAVTIGRRTIARFSFNDTGDTATSMGYRAERFTFKATGGSTVLGFKSLDAETSANGPEISDITVVS